MTKYTCSNPSLEFHLLLFRVGFARLQAQLVIMVGKGARNLNRPFSPTIQFMQSIALHCYLPAVNPPPCINSGMSPNQKVENGDLAD